MPGHQEQLERLQPLRDGGVSGAVAERLISEVNGAIRGGGLSQGPADYDRAATQLREQGILPNLILREFNRLDNDRDGRVSETELRRVIGMGRNADFLTAVAARGLRGTLQDMGGERDPRTGEYSVERSRFEAYVRARQQPVAPQERPPAQPARPGETRPPGEARPPAEATPAPRPQAPPELHPNPAAQRQIDILQAGSGSPQERLAAVAELARLGVSRITLTDSNGDRINCRIQVSRVAPGSDRSYVHLFGRNGNEREEVLLRGVEQNGQFSQQQRADRSAAGYAGDNWTRSRPTSVLGVRP